MGKNFNINLVLLKLKEKRKIFVSETDLQIEIGFIIKELYPTAKVRAEYCPSFNSNMHIDIVVIYEGNLYAIELKYKTKKCCKIIDNEIYNFHKGMEPGYILEDDKDIKLNFNYYIEDD